MQVRDRLEALRRFHKEWGQRQRASRGNHRSRASRGHGGVPPSSSSRPTVDLRYSLESGNPGASSVQSLVVNADDAP